ncbi:hypothetical protein P3S68_008721 [Capsicum galapagoense]
MPSEASNWGMPSYLRQLFVMLLLSNSMSRPEFIWEATWMLLSEDILYEVRRVTGNPGIELTNDEMKNRCLQKLDNLLKDSGRSFQNFSAMPKPTYNAEQLDVTNRLILEELRYNKCSLSKEHEKLLNKLTEEQRSIYDRIITTVKRNKGGFFFLYGHGGIGKTFIWRTLSSAIRSKGDIVLTVASSGIASLLLSGGRTAHSRFAIPLNATEDSTCNIKQGSPLASLIVKTKLIIWDEAPMMHRYCFEALDKTLRDILRFEDISNLDRLFGGKTVVLGGDFRQILSVITKGNRQDIINATLNFSYLWADCHLLKLTKNMRLEGNHESYLNARIEFTNWILAVGDGMIGNSVDGIGNVPILDDVLISDYEDPISAIVNSTYLDFYSHCSDVTYLQKRASLAPTLDMVESINEHMVSLNQSEGTTFFSSDTMSFRRDIYRFGTSTYS